MRGISWMRRAAFGAALLLGVAWSDASAAWRVAGQIGGPISAVAASGNTAYVGVGARVVIYDLANPAAPREIGATSALDAFVSNLIVSGSRIYAAAGTAGVYIFDVGDPSRPALVGRWDSPGSAENIAVAGNTVYVADGPFGLQIVDFSNPTAPLASGSAFDMHFAFDVVVQGSHAFVAAAGSGLLVADVTDPARPREVTTVDTPGFARALALSDRVLFLADQWGGVRVYDIGDPARPRATAGIDTPSWAFDIAVAASTLVVADGTRGLRVYAAADPLGGELASHEIPSQLSWRVAAAGDLVLVAARGSGVLVFDIRSQRRVGVISPVSNVQSISVRDGVAFLGTGDQGLRIVDVSDSSRPVERGATAEGRGWAVLADDSRAYLCHGISPTTHRLRIFDVGDLDRPREVGAVRIPEALCRDLVRSQQWLFVPNEVGVQVFDLSNPDAPSPAGAVRVPIPGTEASTAGVNSIALAGTTAFVPNSTNGVSALDISDPRNPRRIGGWSQAEPPVSVYDIDARNGFVYAVSGLPVPELIVLDARDPARLVRVGGALLPEQGNHVTVRGSQAFVAAGASGVVVYDVANAAAPREVERIATPGYANTLAFAGSRLLVAAGDGGLYVLESAQGTSAPASTISGRRAVGPSPPSGTSAPSRIAAATAAPTPERNRPIRSAPSAAGRSVVVSSTGDTGAGTLRDALTNLQADDVITFDPGVFPPGSPARVRPTSPLPRISRNGVTIDASNAGVILDGSALSGRFDAGLSITSSGNTIKGLQIVDFPHAGISVSGNGGNVIGGDRSRGAGPSGEGNVISRNVTAGVQVLNPNSNRIVGNRIGTDVTGRIGLGRQERGVWIFFQPGNGDATGGDWVGGFEPWEANVIAGNLFDEVNLQQASGNRVVGNYIGTDPSGAIRVGEAQIALQLGVAADNVIHANVIVARQHALLLVDAGSWCNQISGNWIGLSKAGTPIVRDSVSTGVGILESFNLVANNAIGGVQYGGVSVNGYQAVATETVIIGNRIGTGLGGPRPERWGISLGAASHTFIGGATEAERNFVIGNELGIRLLTPGVESTFVMGNSIGVDGAGRPNRNTGDGIDIGPARLSFVQGNAIAENGGRGIVVSGGRNRLRRNSIFANGGGGVVVTGSGFPAPPVIQSAGGSTATGTACPLCVVEIYSDDRDQARAYEGAAIADAAGQFAFTKNGLLLGPNITGAATDAAGTTSAFSGARRSAASTSSVATNAPETVSPEPGSRNRTVGRPYIAPVVRDVRQGVDSTIVVVASDAEPMDVALSLRGPDGIEVQGGRRLTRLPARTRLATSAGELFPDAATAAFRGTVIATAPGAAAAAVLHGGSRGEPTPHAFSPIDAPAAHELWFPYVVTGGGVSSTMVVINPLSTINTGEIAFYDRAGQPMAMDLDGSRRSSRFSFTLPPYGSTTVSTSSEGEAMTGSARVTSGGMSVAGASSFRSPADGTAIMSPAKVGSVAVVPISRSVTAGATTLVAIVSTEAGATATLTLVDAKGQPLGEQTVVLPPHGQHAAVIEHLFGAVDTKELSGHLIVSAGPGPIVATAVRVKPAVQ